MRAGRLFHRVTVRRPGTPVAKDEYGGDVTVAPTVLARTHADVAPLTGREFFDAQQVAAEVNRRVRLRWQPDLATLRPKDQLVFAGRVLDIEYVANRDERNRELELLCRELV